VFTPGVSYNTVIVYFLLYLSIGLREEIAFRGYPLFSLNRSAGPWIALLVVGIIFIIEHIAGGMGVWAAFLGSGAGSLLFGIAALKTKGLALPIGLHSAWNFGQWTLGFKNEAGPFTTIIEKGYNDRIEVIGWISYLLVMGLAIFVLYNSWKKNKNSAVEKTIQKNIS
jgi:membrane protease YdiL (CAAX protease family)